VPDRERGGREQLVLGALEHRLFIQLTFGNCRAEHDRDGVELVADREGVGQGDALALHIRALSQAIDVRSGLLDRAGALQTGILTPPVLQMRTLIAAEADAFPHLAADYISRSWDRNISRLAPGTGRRSPPVCLSDGGRPPLPTD
jgi:hypothetical protein